MNDENFSVVNNEKRGRNLYRQNNSFSKGINILLALGLNVFIYAMTYFNPSFAEYSDGDVKNYVFYALGAGGFYLCYSIIELYKQSRGESIEEDEAGIDAEFMGTYRYTTFQDKKWLAYVISGAAGGVNVLIYLAFLGFIAK